MRKWLSTLMVENTFRSGYGILCTNQKHIHRESYSSNLLISSGYKPAVWFHHFNYKAMHNLACVRWTKARVKAIQLIVKTHSYFCILTVNVRPPAKQHQIWKCKMITVIIIVIVIVCYVLRRRRSKGRICETFSSFKREMEIEIERENGTTTNDFHFIGQRN